MSPKTSDETIAMLRPQNAVLVAGLTAMSNAAFIRPSMTALPTQRTAYITSHPTTDRESEKVIAPTMASIAQIMTTPLATQPPRIHWNRNGSSRLMKTCRNLTGPKFFVKWKNARFRIVRSV